MKFVKELKGKIGRRLDYDLLVNVFGYPSSTAQRLKDWSWGHIELYILEGPKFGD